MIKQILVSILLASTVGGVALADEPGLTAKTVKLGSYKNLIETEDPRPSGMSRGQKMYFDKINKSGGIHGRMIELIEYDDAHEPKRSADNVRRLINDDKVFLLFGSYGTANLKATAPVSSAAGVPHFGVVGSVGVITEEQQKMIFGVKGTYIDEASAAVKYAVEKKNWKKVAIFSQDDAFGSEGRGGLIKALHERSLKPALTKTFSRDAAELDDNWLPDFKAAGVQAIMIWGNEKGGLKTLEILGKKNLKIPVLVGSALVASTFVKRVGEMNIETYFFQGYPLVTQPEVPIVAEYLKDAAKNGTKPSDLELIGYVDAAIFCEALRLTGPQPTRKSFVETVEKQMTNLSYKGVQVSFAPNRHSGMQQIHIYAVKNGVLSPL